MAISLSKPLLLANPMAFFVEASYALLGSLFIALLSQVEVYLTSVPFTLQTMGLFILPLTMGRRGSCYAALAYLAEASCGLPVLSGWHSNPLWMIGPCGGYLLAFPVAALVIGSVERQLGGKALWKSSLALLAGVIVLFALGLAQLSLFVGLQQAFYIGLLPFLLTEPMKMAAALSMSRLFHRAYQKEDCS